MPTTPAQSRAEPLHQEARDAVSSKLDQAAQALKRRTLAEAERILIGLLALAPQNPDALRLLGICQHGQRNYAAAMVTLRQALAARPHDAMILNDLGSALCDKGDVDGALAAFQRATELAPNLKTTWFNLGKVLKDDLRPQQAQVAFERALQCDPDYAPAWASLGDALKAMGDIEGAAHCYRTGLRCPGRPAQIWYHLANLKTVRLTSEDVDTLRRALGSPALSDDDRIYLGYALSKALEDQQQYEAGFAALQNANRLKRRRVSWDASAFSADIAAIEAAFPRPLTQTAAADLGCEVIFVICIPRSGSTLTEQILAAHPQVEGGNELTHLHMILFEESARRGCDFPHWVAAATAADWQRLGEQYLARTERWRRDKPRFTDKGLTNWQFIGAAAAMLPGARFVNCRRDALETCVSCYGQLFADGSEFSYDLAELGAYWRDYDRLSRAWLALYPERIFEQVYENLLTDPETRIRELLCFLDLPFNRACLEFHRAKRVVRTASAAQVRQPLQPASARASRYGAMLDPLRAALRIP
ncbi:MAG: sulfotransferase [Rudaea sp.]|nr:sulfotransferase [Rudaea sp.]